MQKPDINGSNTLFREFTIKKVESAPSIKSNEMEESVGLQSNMIGSNMNTKNKKNDSEQNNKIEDFSSPTHNNHIEKKLIELTKTSEFQPLAKKHKAKEDGRYNPFKIPPDWDLAMKHANSRKATRELEEEEDIQDKKDEICPCCGFEVNRKPLKLCESTSKLNFLGAGYPLIFNYYLYCVLILTVLFLSFGVYAIYSNYNGNFCVESSNVSVQKTSERRLMRYLNEETSSSNSSIIETSNSSNSSEAENTTEAEGECIIDWIMIISLANKLGDKESCEIQNYFAIVAEVLIIIILMHFRKHQRKINNEVDEQTNTPADYTIMVSGIPLGLSCDYKAELKKIFHEDVEANKKYNVEKVNLVFNTEEIEKLEKDLKKVINKKKKALLESDFDEESKNVLEFDKQFEEIEHNLHKTREHMIKTNEKFAGIAFISFSTEDEKQEIIEKQKVSTIERIERYFKKDMGKHPDDNRLFFKNTLLYIEEAPEPNDVNWEFIYAQTKDKIKIRLFLNLLFVLLLALCFSIIWVITYFQSKSIEHAHDNEIKGLSGAADEFNRAKSISIVISALIVVFNKFCLGRMVHILSDHEKYSNFTKLNMSFGTKLSTALFFNTALITLFVEMITFNNYYGYGGMITTEHTIFILNAFLPPFVWFFDPWSIKKYFEKKFLMKKVIKTKNKVSITQCEANEIMEDVEYNMAKRYAEIMKTMWFTFFYAPAIPIGILWSAVGILLYYWVDKYNLIKRRTVKENISMNLTINMIELLELSLIFFGFSCVLLEKELNDNFSIPAIIVLIIAVVHSVLPMEEINEKLFPLKSQNETTPYKDGVLDFDTDYDRENPVTKSEAILKWATLRNNRSLTKSPKQTMNN